MSAGIWPVQLVGRHKQKRRTDELYSHGEYLNEVLTDEVINKVAKNCRPKKVKFRYGKKG